MLIEFAWQFANWKYFFFQQTKRQKTKNFIFIFKLVFNKFGNNSNWNDFVVLFLKYKEQLKYFINNIIVCVNFDI